MPKKDYFQPYHDAFQKLIDVTYLTTLKLYPAIRTEIVRHDIKGNNGIELTAELIIHSDGAIVPIDYIVSLKEYIDSIPELRSARGYVHMYSGDLAIRLELVIPNP